MGRKWAIADTIRKSSGPSSSKGWQIAQGKTKTPPRLEPGGVAV
jgi:hypothetical protein